MEIVIKGNIVEIWVAKDTEDDLVNSVFQAYHALYKDIVIYRSGRENLVDLTCYLLGNNLL